MLRENNKCHRQLISSASHLIDFNCQAEPKVSQHNNSKRYQVCHPALREHDSSQFSIRFLIFIYNEVNFLWQFIVIVASSHLCYWLLSSHIWSHARSLLTPTSSSYQIQLCIFRENKCSEQLSSHDPSDGFHRETKSSDRHNAHKFM